MEKIIQRRCPRDPSRFCYICACYITYNKRTGKFDAELKEQYESYFGREITDLDEIWTPSRSCFSCYRALKGFYAGHNPGPKFVVPAIWSNIRSCKECHFCNFERLCDTHGNPGLGKARPPYVIKRAHAHMVDTIHCQLPRPPTASNPLPVFVKKVKTPVVESDSSESSMDTDTDLESDTDEETTN